MTTFYLMLGSAACGMAIIMGYVDMRERGRAYVSSGCVMVALGGLMFILLGFIAK